MIVTSLSRYECVQLACFPPHQFNLLLILQVVSGLLLKPLGPFCCLLWEDRVIYAQVSLTEAWGYLTCFTPSIC